MNKQEVRGVNAIFTGHWHHYMTFNSALKSIWQTRISQDLYLFGKEIHKLMNSLVYTIMK